MASGCDPIIEPVTPVARVPRVLARTIQGVVVLLGLAVFTGCSRPEPPPAPSLEALKRSGHRIVLTDPEAGEADSLQLIRTWEGNICRSRLTNPGTKPVQVQEIVLFAGKHELPPESGLYGEGFTMLSQTGGSLEVPVDLGAFTDRKHYKIPQPANATTVYSLALLSPPGGGHRLMAFSSCNRFQGAVRLRPEDFEVVLDTENLALGPGKSWELEEFVFVQGNEREELFTTLAGRIATHHPRLPFPQVPAGWCSWYCFGPEVTYAQVVRNLTAIAERIPQLKYVQVDDGYQAKMGDWLELRRSFGGEMKSLCREISRRGFEPGIWVAPFIAEEKSKVFQEHPHWFIRNSDGKPLRSDLVSFGGWRQGPWYALDGTHPEVQRHLENVFRTMREDWGVTYFKLDATFWGALHSGRFHDPEATRIEAYRRGMAAVLRGAGNAFVLAGNHPMWPSLGLIHGSRSSMDVARTWNSIRSTALENFHRGWQHGRLWLNDPDVIMVTGKLSEKELMFRWSAAYATGGLMLAGDDLSALPEDRLSVLRKLVPPTGVAARFADESFRVGTVELPGKRMFCLFNWDDGPQNVDVELSSRSRLKDFWSGEDLGVHEGLFRLREMPARSARVIVATPTQKE